MARQKVKLDDIAAARPPKVAPLPSPSPDAGAAPDAPETTATPKDKKTKKPRAPRRVELSEVRKAINKQKRAKKKPKKRRSGGARARDAERKAAAAAAGEPPPEDIPAPGTPGRPPFVMDEDMQAQVQAAAAFGCSIDDIATLLVISPSTIYAHKAEFEEQLARGRTIARSRVRRSLFENAVSGSLGHATMWLKVVDGWRENVISEISGPGGGPIETNVTGRLMTDDEISARLLTLVERSRGVMAQPSEVALDDERLDRLPEAQAKEVPDNEE